MIRRGDGSSSTWFFINIKLESNVWKTGELICGKAGIPSRAGMWYNHWDELV